MKFSDEIGQLYYRILLNELRLLNRSTEFPKLSYNSLLYLDLISMTPNCTISHLAQILHIAKSSVTLKINELVKQGFVIKEQSDADRRVYYLSVSPQIYDEYKNFDKTAQKAIKKLEEKYSESELELVSQMIHDFSTYYET